MQKKSKFLLAALCFLSFFILPHASVVAQKLTVKISGKKLRIRDERRNIVCEEKFKKKIKSVVLSPDNQFVFIQFEGETKATLKNISSFTKKLDDIDFIFRSKREIYKAEFCDSGEYFALLCSGSLYVADLRRLDWEAAQWDPDLPAYKNYDPDAFFCDRKILSLYETTGVKSKIKNFYFVPNNNRFFCVKYESNRLEVYDLARSAKRILRKEGFDKAIFSPDGKYIAVKYKSGTIRVFDLLGLSLTRRKKRIYKYKNKLKAICFSQNGRYVAFLATSGLLTLVNLAQRGALVLCESGVKSLNFSDCSKAVRVTYVRRIRRKNKQKVFELFALSAKEGRLQKPEVIKPVVPSFMISTKECVTRPKKRKLDQNSPKPQKQRRKLR